MVSRLGSVTVGSGKVVQTKHSVSLCNSLKPQQNVHLLAKTSETWPRTNKEVLARTVPHTAVCDQRQLGLAERTRRGDSRGVLVRVARSEAL